MTLAAPIQWIPHESPDDPLDEWVLCEEANDISDTEHAVEEILGSVEGFYPKSETLMNAIKNIGARYGLKNAATIYTHTFWWLTHIPKIDAHIRAIEMALWIPHVYGNQFRHFLQNQSTDANEAHTYAMKHCLCMLEKKSKTKK